MIRALACLLCCLLLWHPPLAHAAPPLACPPAQMPQIIVTPHENPIVYDYTQNRGAMNAMGHDILVDQHATANTYVGGLAHGLIAAQLNTNFQTLTQSLQGAPAGNGTGCLWISQINVTLDYKPTIYVSSEYQPETCYRRAVLEHEHKHIMVDRQLINEFLPVLQAKAQQAAQQTGVIGPIPEASISPASSNLESQLEVQLNNFMEQLSAERNRRQAMVDTKEEYARVQAQCQNWP